jgi:hypothetical protein
MTEEKKNGSAERSGVPKSPEEMRSWLVVQPAGGLLYMGAPGVWALGGFSPFDLEGSSKVQAGQAIALSPAYVVQDDPLWELTEKPTQEKPYPNKELRGTRRQAVAPMGLFSARTVELIVSVIHVRFSELSDIEIELCFARYVERTEAWRQITEETLRKHAQRIVVAPADTRLPPLKH